MAFYFLVFPHLVLKLAFESDADQLEWLKQFEKSGVATGQTEEVTCSLFLLFILDLVIALAIKFLKSYLAQNRLLYVTLFQ